MRKQKQYIPTIYTHRIIFNLCAASNLSSFLSFKMLFKIVCRKYTYDKHEYNVRTFALYTYFKIV